MPALGIIADVPLASVGSEYPFASVSETATAADTVASVGVLNSVVAEVATASDSVAAGGGAFNSTIAEAATALDTVSSVGVLHSAIVETAAALDALDATGTFHVAVAEAASASDATSSTQQRLVWFLDFSDVVPPPPGEGPGNPGKLFGSFHYVEWPRVTNRHRTEPT